VDRFVLTAQGSVNRIRQTARDQITAYGDEIRRGAQTVESSAPDLQFGKRQLAFAAQTNQRGRDQGPRPPVMVQAPVTLGGIQVSGYNKDPHELASEIKNRVWGELADSIGFVWREMEGSVG
jgi:hypothetical protein